MARKKTAAHARKGTQWVRHVAETSNAMDLPPGIFTRPPKEIARGLRQSVLRSRTDCRRPRAISLGGRVKMPGPPAIRSAQSSHQGNEIPVGHVDAEPLHQPQRQEPRRSGPAATGGGEGRAAEGVQA